MLNRSALGLLVLLGTYSAQAQQQGIPYYQPGPGKSNYDYERDREMCTKLVRPRNDAKYSECMAARGDLVFQRTTNGLVPSAPALSPQQAQAYQVPFQRPSAAGTCQRFARGDPQMYNKCLSSAHLDAQLTCRQTTKERGAYMQCMAANGFLRETQTLDEQHATEERQLRAMGAIMDSWAKSPPRAASQNAGCVDECGGKKFYCEKRNFDRGCILSCSSGYTFPEDCQKAYYSCTQECGIRRQR